MSQSKGSVIVIGAGIVGSACAYEFATRNYQVTIIDKATPGSSATAAAMGHIVVMDDSEAQFALTSYSRQLWSDLIPALPLQCEATMSGTLWIAQDQEEMEEVLRKHEFYSQRNIETQVIDADRLQEYEPNLRKDMLGALRVPGDWVVYPACVAQYFVDEIIARNGKVILNTSVAAIKNKTVTLDNGQALTADIIINAAGSDSPSLTKNINIRPRKGHLVITDRYPNFVTHQLIELGYLKSAHSMGKDSVAFNIQPRPTGQLLIGSSREFDIESSEIDNDILDRMLKKAIAYMPEIKNLNCIRSWTGFRAATPDKLPLIGPVDDHPGLFLATGHEGLGITTSLATAKLLADHITGNEPAIPLQPYLPSRYNKS